MLRKLAPLALALAAPALAQYEGAAPSRRQKLLLEPLVQATAMRLELHLPSFTADDLEKRVEKALGNQVTHVVERRFKELVIELLIEDLGVSKGDTKKVQYGPYETFGRAIPGWTRELTEFSGRSWDARDKGAYDVTGVVRDHRGVLQKDADAEYRIKSWIGRELSSDQERGLKELSKYWAARLEAELGFERRNRRFHELAESMFLTQDTERAVLGILCKLRFLVRPEVRGGLEAEGFEELIAAEESVTQTIVRQLGDAEWWPQLQADHRAMVSDPKQHRAVLKNRIKAEKAAAKADDGEPVAPFASEAVLATARRL